VESEVREGFVCKEFLFPEGLVRFFGFVVDKVEYELSCWLIWACESYRSCSCCEWRWL